MTRYPYPVLTVEGSSYKDEVEFELTYVRSVSFPEKISFEFNIKMNSISLKKMLEEKKAKMIMKVQTGFYSESVELNVIEGNVKCNILLENIEANDTLKFICYIVANDELLIEYSDELIDVYDKDYSVCVRKKDVLAISNEESLCYSTSNNDFIKFSVSEDQNGKGYVIKYATNFITVIIGPDFNQAYGIVKNNKREACTIFDGHLVFEIFTYVLIDLVQQYEEYNEEPWYKLFEQVFLQTGEYKSFDEFIKCAKDGDLIDMGIVYNMAHKMINNQIENSLISLSKIEEV